jgi:hypothetical protein
VLAPDSVRWTDSGSPDWAYVRRHRPVVPKTCAAKGCVECRFRRWAANAESVAEFEPNLLDVRSLSAKEKICSVSRRAGREIWKVGGAGISSRSACGGAGSLNVYFVNRELDRKTNAGPR